MNSTVLAIENASSWLMIGVMVVLAVLLILCLIRAILGPRVADRLVAVNMIGTIVMVIIGILTVLLGEGYLADICLIYAMISFLAVVILSKIYIGDYREEKQQQKQEQIQKQEEPMQRRQPTFQTMPEEIVQKPRPEQSVQKLSPKQQNGSERNGEAEDGSH